MFALSFIMDATRVFDAGMTTGVVKLVLTDPPVEKLCEDESVLVMESVAASPSFMLFTVSVEMSAVVS